MRREAARPQTEGLTGWALTSDRRVLTSCLSLPHHVARHVATSELTIYHQGEGGKDACPLLSMHLDNCNNPSEAPLTGFPPCPNPSGTKLLNRGLWSEPGSCSSEQGLALEHHSLP